ncbi:hypothetical protein [Neorhizobium sp. SOG26]|nr:hypothetical protein [Neorhizobium sp. SOG26]
MDVMQVNPWLFAQLFAPVSRHWKVIADRYMPMMPLDYAENFRGALPER